MPGLLTRDTKPKYRLLYYRAWIVCDTYGENENSHLSLTSQNRREQNKKYCLLTNITHTLILSKFVFLFLYFFLQTYVLQQTYTCERNVFSTAIQRVKGLTCFSDDEKESVLKHTVNHSNTTALKILFKE